MEDARFREILKEEGVRGDFIDSLLKIGTFHHRSGDAATAERALRGVVRKFIREYPEVKGNG
jgi:hypothetical protein